jgi:hypothetical protein
LLENKRLGCCCCMNCIIFEKYLNLSTYRIV